MGGRTLAVRLTRRQARELFAIERMGGRTPGVRLTPRQAREFLVEWVNVRRTDQAAIDRFHRRFGHWFPPILLSAPPRLAVPGLALSLRELWESPDERTREFMILRLRLNTTPFVKPPHLPLPPPSPFEDALRYLERARTLVCQNPDCQAKYFFGTRRTQKYCSRACAEYGQRAAKRRWWAKDGTDWRKARKQSRRGAKKR